jgi:hypothetical protein
MTVRLHVELDRLPQTNQRTDGIQDERYACNARDKKGMNNNGGA